MWVNILIDRRAFVHLIYAHQTKMLNVFLSVFAYGKRGKDKQKRFSRRFFFHLFSRTLQTFIFAIENCEGNKLRIKIESKHKIPFADFLYIFFEMRPVRWQIYTLEKNEYIELYEPDDRTEKGRNFSFYLSLLIDAAWWDEHENEEKTNPSNHFLPSHCKYSHQTFQVPATPFVWLMYFDFIEVDFLPKHNVKPFDQWMCNLKKKNL